MRSIFTNDRHDRGVFLDEIRGDLEASIWHAEVTFISRNPKHKDPVCHHSLFSEPEWNKSEFSYMLLHEGTIICKVYIFSSILNSIFNCFYIIFYVFQGWCTTLLSFRQSLVNLVAVILFHVYYFFVIWNVV